MRLRTSGLRVLAAVPVLLAAACGGGAAGDESPAASGSGRPSEVTGTVVVFAAASLTSAFEQIGEQFERAHPSADVVLSFGGSSALAQQVLAGAPADVFAAASPATMQTVVDAGDAADPTVFARNRLEIAVPPGNPGGVEGLADFGRDELDLALCAPEVPCGAAAKEVLAVAGVRGAPDTLEQDVKAALAKVRLGEVDAALVYRTDVRAAGDEVTGIPFPEADDAVNDYPLAVLDQAPNAAAAQAFVDQVLSADGRRVLDAAGFDRP